MKRFGHKMPERFKEIPELLPGLGMYLDAFIELDNDRKTLEGVLPIKWSEIVRYAEVYSLSIDETDELVFIIKKMDSAHLERILPKKKDG